MTRTDDLASLRDVLPRPRAVRLRKGEYRLAPGVKIVVTNRGDAAAVAAAKLLQELVRQHRGWRWGICDGGGAGRGRVAQRARGTTDREVGGNVIVIERLVTGAGDGEPIARPAKHSRGRLCYMERAQQWYALRIRPDGIHLRAAGAAGLRYGVLTLGQLIAASRARRPRHADTAEGGCATDTAEGGCATDTAEGGCATDTAEGGCATDTAEGGGATSTAEGGCATDTAEGGCATDTAEGGCATDTAEGGCATDTAEGGCATDTAEGGGATSTAEGGRATAIQAMDIEDWPDFAARGVMLDISRDKVPTLATLERLIDLLAGWKINQLQLYTEHAFAYAGHERVWRGASPLTGPQIEHLDRYCRQRGVELVPNQNSFGHLERWLKHAAYADLAETAGPWKTPWGETRTTATTLNPLDPRGLRLVASLYDQLLPHFYSRLFNVGGDETWELGQGRSAAACRRRGVGRVYLDYLRKLHREVRRRGRRMMFWADIAQQHPELIAELPDDVIPLVWGYEADHPFDMECARLAQRGLEFYVCPGTSSWCSFAGRSRNCLANLRRAAESGVRHGASGYLVTDWGDFGHRQYLPASYLGFAYGAAVSWCGATNAKIDAARAVSRHAFGDPTGTVGRLWFEAGAVHELSGVSLKNRTVLFAIMRAAFVASAPRGRRREFVGPPEGASLLRGREGRWRRMERRIDELRARAERAKFPAGDGALARDELLTTLAVLRHACRRGWAMLARRAGRDIRRDCRELAADMRRIMRQHRRLWLARNRPGGLASSLDYYRRNLREYLAGSK